MIKVVLKLSAEQDILALTATGHAGFAPKGADIVCSAVTILLRTFVHCVQSRQEWTGDVAAQSEGMLSLTTRNVKGDLKGLYRGWCGFLLRGLEELAQDYPDWLCINLQKTRGECFYGS